jgi:hypothetical protein
LPGSGRGIGSERGFASGHFGQNNDLTPAAFLAGAVAHFQRAMMMDVDQSAKAMKDADIEAEIEAEIEDFLEGFNQPTYRGMRINGSGWLHG